MIVRKCNCIDDENTNGIRPIHFAELTGKANFKKYLLEKGAAPVGDISEIIKGNEDLAPKSTVEDTKDGKDTKDVKDNKEPCSIKDERQPMSTDDTPPGNTPSA